MERGEIVLGTCSSTSDGYYSIEYCSGIGERRRERKRKREGEREGEEIEDGLRFQFRQE